MTVYFNGDFLDKEEVRISPDDRGFLFADGAYEVMRAYNGTPFMVDNHFRRLERSLGELRITGIDTGPLRDASEKLLALNDLEETDAAIYIEVTRGASPRAHAFPPDDTPPTIFMSATPFPLLVDEMREGAKIILIPDLRWLRCDIKSVSLLPNILASQQAREQGAIEAVLVRDGVITEGASSNFAAVFDGRLVTHPECELILSGITRKVALDLCGELGIPVDETPIPEESVREADEIIVLSTRKEVMPVIQVDDRTVGDGKPGPVTMKLQKAFRDLVVRLCGA
jgi:D-alanine transaminase